MPVVYKRLEGSEIDARMINHLTAEIVERYFSRCGVWTLRAILIKVVLFCIHFDLLLYDVVCLDAFYIHSFRHHLANTSLIKHEVQPEWLHEQLSASV
jgi:hypothetical protein